MKTQLNLIDSGGTKFGLVGSPIGINGLHVGDIVSFNTADVESESCHKVDKTVTSVIVFDTKKARFGLYGFIGTPLTQENAESMLRVVPYKCVTNEILSLNSFGELKLQHLVTRKMTASEMKAFIECVANFNVEVVEKHDFPPIALNSEELEKELSEDFESALKNSCTKSTKEEEK